MGHDHAHDSEGHAHGIDASANRTPLLVAFGLIASFMLVEVVVGLLAGSLALLSDAAHMLTDAGAILLALVAAQLAARPAKGAFTFGWRRAEILSAQVNGAVLLALAAYIVFDAVRRLSDPPDVDGGLVVVVGVLGALVNVAAAWSIARAQRQSLNVAGARAHVMMDLLGSVGATAAGVIVLATGFDAADPLIALLISVLMIRSAWALLRDSGRVLLEAAPVGADPDEIGRAIARVPSVSQVHDLHVWEVTSGFVALSAHVVVERDADCHAVRLEVESVLHDRFGIEHTTLQTDHAAGPALLAIQPAFVP